MIDMLIEMQMIEMFWRWKPSSRCQEHLIRDILGGRDLNLDVLNRWCLFTLCDHSDNFPGSFSTVLYLLCTLLYPTPYPNRTLDVPKPSLRNDCSNLVPHPVRSTCRNKNIPWWSVGESNRLKFEYQVMFNFLSISSYIGYIRSRSLLSLCQKYYSDNRTMVLSMFLCLPDKGNRCVLINSQSSSLV